MVQIAITCIALVVFVFRLKRIVASESTSNITHTSSGKQADTDANSTGKIALIASFVRSLPFTRRSLVRSLVFLLALIFLAVYAAAGLVAFDVVSFVILAIVLVACALLQLRMHCFIARIDGKLSHNTRWARPVVAFILCVLFAFLALEIPSNHVIVSMKPYCVIIELALIALVMLVLYFLFQRRAYGLVIAIVAFLLLGLSEYFVITFKNMPIMPSDLLAIGTAAAVSANYVYLLSAYAIYGIMFAAIGCALAPFASTPARRIGKAEPRRHLRRVLSVGINLLIAAAAAAALYCGVFKIDYLEDLNVSVDAWQPLRAYYKQGFLPSFIVNYQNIEQEEPDGYSDEYADELLAEYVEEYEEIEASSERYQAASSQFEEEQPCVIAIMNETFSDLSIYDELDSNYTGPENFQNINDALVKGKLYVSAYGGGTCNSEFEFLTGASLGYMGSGVYPYQLYNLSGAQSIVSTLTDAGYTATAIHPNAGTNWNRDNVYEALGFDDFLTIEDFEGAETYRDMVSDSATYDKILDILESSDDPQFVFDVTMQNHSGYLTDALPDSMKEEYVDYNVANEDSMAETNEYLSLIDESDRALAEFLEALQELDRPVVVIFFGDHQPSFSSDYNEALMSDDEGTIEYTQRLWQTEYMIWANYDVAETDQTSTIDDTSACFLAAQALDLIGAPLSDYQKAQIAIRQEMPAINLMGYQGADREWYWHEQSSDYEDSYYALQYMQYRMLFRNGTDPYAVEYSTATNDVDPTEIKSIGSTTTETTEE